jgi:DNA mismatch repair protein MutS2
MQADFQDLLSELHRQVEENQQRSNEIDVATEALRKRQADLEAETIRQEQQRQREWQKKSDAMIAEFEGRAQAAMDRLTDLAAQRKASDQAHRLVAKTAREFREEAAEAMAPPPEIAKAAAPERLVIEEGSRVRLKDVRELATVRRILKNGMLEVEAGFLKMQVAREDVKEVVSEKAEALQSLKNIRFESGPRWDVSYRELNLVGQRAEEALENVDKFLDSAALASVNRVRIIHGHGMGVLKRAVNDYLGSNPHVSRFYPATSTEGGAGATIVELRE